MKQIAPILSVLVKHVSADCNLACRYCFYSSKADLYPETRRHRMNDNVLRELIAQFMFLSPDRVSFCWQGGEPTLADPRGLYNFFLREGFRYLQFIPYVERDREKGGVAEYSITPEQYGRFLCEVFDE